MASSTREVVEIRERKKLERAGSWKTPSATSRATHPLIRQYNSFLATSPTTSDFAPHLSRSNWSALLLAPHHLPFPAYNVFACRHRPLPLSRCRLIKTEIRTGLHSARADSSAALAQGKVRVEAGLAATEGGWHSVGDYLDVSLRREAEVACAQTWVHRAVFMPWLLPHPL